MSDKIIYIKDFSEYPGLRHCSISDDSGEEYYHNILNNAFHEAFTNNEKLIVNLDSTAGYAPSFLDEAFGNLIFDFGLDTVSKSLEIISEQEPDLKQMIIDETFPQWETRRKKNDKPKKTESHKAWYSLKESKLIKNTN